MKCEKCGTEYPSQYYFKNESKLNKLICNKCCESCTTEEIESFLSKTKEKKVGPDTERPETEVVRPSYKKKKLNVVLIALLGCVVTITLLYSISKIDIYNASKRGNLFKLELVLTLKPKLVNTQNKWGLTPLHYASIFDKKDAVELLINKGADINRKDFGADASRLITKLENDILKGEFVSEIIKGIQIVRQYEAAINGDGRYDIMDDTEIIERIEKISNDINNMTGDTPLHAAAKRNCKNVAEILISKGAEVNSRGQFFATPLYWAARFGYEELVKLLISKGAHVNDYSIPGWGPLYWATRENHIEIVKILVENGADVNHQDDLYGDTPLHAAAKNGSIAVIEELIKHGAKVNIRNYLFKQTPLSIATEEDHKEVTDLLRKHGGIK